MTKKPDYKLAQQMVDDLDEYNTLCAAGVISGKTGVNFDKVVKMIVGEPVKPTAPNAPCHYCGQKATAWGFFDEPICRQCGG